MKKLLFISTLCFALLPTLRADWDLYDHFDSVLAYEGNFFQEFSYSEKRIDGNGGMLLQGVSMDKKGRLKPFSGAMIIGDGAREKQLMLSGVSMVAPTVIEFVVTGGKQLHLEYGLYDGAVKAGNQGGRLELALIAGDQEQKDQIRVTENQWTARTFPLPAAEKVLVRLSMWRLGGGSTNWCALLLHGDGEIGTREEARQLSPNGKLVSTEAQALKPSPHRVTAKPGYDVLFYKDQPFISFATKGNPPGSEAMQGKLGFNTFYVEGLSFSAYWPEGAPGVTIPPDSRIHHDLRLSQEYDMPFKAPISMAHCSAFLPAWLVKKENLGLEGHQLRRGGATHTSFIKPATLRWHKKGLEGWIKPFLDQPSLFVFGQEDDASLWDDYSEDAVASWRSWLEKRFHGDFRAFSGYVGGVNGIAGFENVPQPKRFEPGDEFGFPKRLAYLKLQWITESYGDYLSDVFTFMRKEAPGIPLTQRYVNWPGAPAVSKRVGFDYNYTFGHLTSEGIPNGYGIGKKIWTGIYAHMGTLPLPRGGSIGKTYSKQIRRGAMSRAEWELNAFTILANGGTGFEYSTLVPTWGSQWEQSALYDHNGKLTPTGEAAAPVIHQALENAKYMLHYEQFPDVAVFHDAAFNSKPMSGAWGQSKVGIYALIREVGFHFDPLDEAQMTAENLRGKKVLVLAGTTSIAPEIQTAIREFVREGGTLLSVFCSDGKGFPGCNSYDYAGAVRESTAEKSFEQPKSAAHLGDVLGIRSGGGTLVAREQMITDSEKKISLHDFNALVTEKRWVAQDSSATDLTLLPESKVTASFEDGSPAVFEHRYGKGRAITLAFDIGLIANNLTIPPLYAWWSDMLTGLGCRKVIDTGNPYVEAGAWHDDSGNRLVILINHDESSEQSATLPDGKTVTLGPWRAQTFVMKRE